MTGYDRPFLEAPQKVRKVYRHLMCRRCHLLFISVTVSLKILSFSTFSGNAFRQLSAATRVPCKRQPWSPVLAAWFKFFRRANDTALCPQDFGRKWTHARS